MVSSSRKFAVVPAGGSGTRMGGRQKLLLPLLDRPVILRTVERLIAADSFEIVVIPCRDEDAEDFKKIFSPIPQVKFCRGGAHRQESVYRGLQFIAQHSAPSERDIVVIHDAARCLVEVSAIRKTIECAESGISAAVGVRVQDTLKKLNEHGEIASTVAREHMIAIQTPQTFPFKLILAAHHKAEGQIHTDDVSLIEGKERVQWIEGSAHNLKITTLADLALAEALLRTGLL